MPRTGTKEAMAACGQAMAPPSPFSVSSYHEPVLMRLWQAVLILVPPRSPNKVFTTLNMLLLKLSQALGLH